MGQQDQLVEQFSDYVVKIAKQIKRNLSPNIETEDLISYGMTGLIEAAQRFDPSYGANFSTFSYYRIKGAIYDGLRAMGSLKRSDYKRNQLEERANHLFEAEYLNKTNEKNLRPEDEIDNLAKKVQKIACIYLTSLDQKELEVIKDSNSEDLDERIARLELYEKMKLALGKLKKIDQDIIKSYYFEDLSLEDVGKKLGLSKSWTSRKHQKAIERLSDLFFGLLKEQPIEKKADKSSKQRVFNHENNFKYKVSYPQN